MSSPTRKTFLTVQEVARELQISASLVYQLVERRRLTCHRIGKGRGAIRVHVDDLADYLRGCRVEREQRTPRTSRRKLRHVDR